MSDTMGSDYADDNPYAAPTGDDTAGDPMADQQYVDPNAAANDQSVNGFSTDDQDQNTAPNPGESANVSAMAFLTACLDCGRTSRIAKLSKRLRCTCGSNEVIYEPVPKRTANKVAFSAPGDDWAFLNIGDLCPYCYRGNLFYQDGDHYDDLECNNCGELFPTEESLDTSNASIEWMPVMSKADVKLLHSAAVYGTGLTIPEILAAQAMVKTSGEFPPKKDDEDDEKDEDAPEDNGTEGPSSAPPVGDPEPPTEETIGADPQNPTKDAPVEEPVDPNSAVAPVEAPVSTDPMDRAQATLEAQVEAVNQLGHDAMETAYDVDELFSEWRCMNCELEGRADIGEDGQVAFSGDLLEAPQGCTMPQQAVPGEQVPAENSVAPNTNGGIPEADQEVVNNVQASLPRQSKRKFLRNPFRRSASSEDEQERELNGMNDQEQELNNYRTELDQNTQSGEDELKAVGAMARSILATNPGMKEKVAYDYARATVRRFPSVVR